MYLYELYVFKKKFCFEFTGTLASDTFFQAYLLDGLARWNEDRAVAATTDEPQPHFYNHLLCHAVNTLAEELMGMKIVPYVGPRKYTGR